MAVGKEIISAFSGPASVSSFKNIGKVSEEKTHKIEYSPQDLKLHKLYKTVAEMRRDGISTIEKLTPIFINLKKNYPSDWLLPLEIYELVYNSNTDLELKLKNYLTQLKQIKKYSQLIDKGLNLISKNN